MKWTPQSIGNLKFLTGEKSLGTQVADLVHMLPEYVPSGCPAAALSPPDWVDLGTGPTAYDGQRAQ